jgi:hypothetical protein
MTNTSTDRRALARRIALAQLARHGHVQQRQVVRLTADNPTFVIRTGR